MNRNKKMYISSVGVVNGPFKMIRVSQTFCEISQVFQSRFLRGLSESRNLKFLQGSLIVTIDLGLAF